MPPGRPGPGRAGRAADGRVGPQAGRAGGRREGRAGIFCLSILLRRKQTNDGQRLWVQVRKQAGHEYVVEAVAHM